MKVFDPNTIDKIKAGQPLTDYIRYHKQLERVAIGYDKGLGRIRWLQGDGLLKAQKKCKRGQWEPYRTQAGIKRSTAYLSMRIATLVEEERSFHLGYHEMCAIAYPSFRKAVAKDAEQNTNNGRSRARRGNNARANRTKQRTRAGSDRKASSQVSMVLAEITADIESISRAARRLAESKYEDDTKTPDRTATKILHALQVLERTQRDLQRVENALRKRLTAIESRSLTLRTG